MSWAIQDKGYTQRRACRLVGLEPKTYRYASTRPDDGALRQRLKELASERRRFGYRRLHLLLRREGVVLNWKKLYRLYREERLTVRKRGGRKRALGTRAPMTIPQGRNQRWSLDFVSDTLASGRKFRMLTVVDDFSRECVAVVVDASLSGKDRLGLLSDRGKRSNELEYQAVRAAWEQFAEAYVLTMNTVVNWTPHLDLNNKTVDEAEKALVWREFKPAEIKSIIDVSDRDRAYARAEQGRRLNWAQAAVYDTHSTIRKQGIFIPIELEEKILETLDVVSKEYAFQVMRFDNPNNTFTPNPKSCVGRRWRAFIE